MERDALHLKEFLYEAGFLSRAQVDAASEEAILRGESFEQTLIRTGHMQEEDVRRATAKSLGLKFVELETYEFEDEALLEIPEPFCRTHNLVPSKKEGNTLTVLLLSVDGLESIKTLHLLCTIEIRITSRQTLKRGLLRYQRVLSVRHGSLIARESRAIEPPLSASMEDMHYSAQRLSVQYVIDALLQHALSQRAASIHLEPRTQGLVVRYRIAGVLHDAMVLPLHAAVSILSRVKILANLSLAPMLSQEGRFKIQQAEHQGGGTVTVRVLTVPVAARAAEEKIVLHLALEQHGRSNFTLESLGFHGAALEAVYRMLSGRQGMLVVYGMESSGQTTLLYTLLDLLIDPSASIITVEDHIELLLPGVMQTEASSEKEISPGARLRAALLMDPDILMMAESATKQVVPAVEAANAGTMVVLGARSGTFFETIEVFASQDLSLRTIAATFQLAIGTKLVRRLCHHHILTKLTRDELQELEARGARLALVLETLKVEGCVDAHAQWKDLLFAHATPCPECIDGYTGLVGLQEVVPVTLSMKHAIRQGDFENLAQESQEAHTLTFLEDGIYKAARGQTSIEEVLQATL